MDDLLREVRLLIERQDRAAVEPLKKMAREASSPQGRVHALWTLHGLKALDDEFIEYTFLESNPEIRVQALRMVEDRLAKSDRLRRVVLELVDDQSPRVRFQLALTLSALDISQTAPALRKLARGAGSWLETAILISARMRAIDLLEELAKDEDPRPFLRPRRPSLMEFRLAEVVGASGSDKDVARALRLAAKENKNHPDWEQGILLALAQGMQNTARPLNRLWENPPAVVKEALEAARPFFESRASAIKTSNKQEQN